MATGVAQQMAAAPRTSGAAAAVKAKNRFDSVFGEIIFKAVNTRDPLVWKDGTKSTKLADVRIETGPGTSLYFRAAINLLEKNAERTVKLQMPSTGGSFKTPIFACEDAASERDFILWCKGVAVRYMDWRKAQGAKGAATISSASAGLSVTDDDLGLSPEPHAPEAPTGN